MKYSVFITKDAEDDIFELYKYIYENDHSGNADKIYISLKKKIRSLERFPDRGHIPPELESVNIFDYQELNYKSYRIIYNILENKVFVHFVLDGRRNISEILAKRILR